MIDFVKFYPLDKERFDTFLQDNGVIDLNSRFNINTGTVDEYPKIGKLENLEVRLQENASFIKGSLHKFHNMTFYGMEHNHNDFSFCECQNTIEVICNNFDILSNKTKLTNLEFGLNITLPKDPKLIIEDNILMYDFSDHTVHEKFNGKGDYKEFKKYDYSLKVYNKSKHYQIGGNILRIEVKIISKRKLHQLGIFNLRDITQKRTFLTLFQFLLEQFNKLMVIDSEMMLKALKRPQNDSFKDYCNPHYWRLLKQDVSDKVYSRNKRDFYDYCHDMGIEQTKNQIRELLKAKFYHLMNCYPTTYYQKVA
ncbi:hypothetical protein [Zobellia alginiliquefaciens]|uniref:hypothetical protein n=1 Tax=Zobellia alginiliquefaciens TaxID=3032586 RepID=UPI0023E36195|nr:hypothetical protein [Zobellia alginiliquefaciens]